MITKRGTQTQDRARRAVSEFRKLQPTLTAYARNLTGKRDVQVVMSSTDNGSTDGKKIYFKPPIKLGDMANMRHEKSLCNKRDPESLQLYCGACNMRESILAIIYHEIAHIAFDSFAAVTKTDAATALRMIERIAPKWYFDRLREAFVKNPNILRGKQTFVELAQAVNPYFKLLVNALEDVRINERMAEARPGTRIMQDAKVLKVANEGVEQKDATGKTVYTLWNEYPTNHQACLAALCVAAGYGDLIDDWFEPRVIEAARDSELHTRLAGIRMMNGAQAIFEESFEIYMRFRELGFFFTADEEPPPEPEPDMGDDSDGSGQSGEGNPGSDSSDSGASGSGKDGEGEPGADGTGSEDHDGDESSRSGSESSDPASMGSDEERDSDPAGSSGQAGDDAGRGEQKDDSGGSGDQPSDTDSEPSGLDEDGEAASDNDSDGVGEDSGNQSGDDGDDTESPAVGDAGDSGSDDEESDVHGGLDSDLSEAGEAGGDDDPAEHDERESDGNPGDPEDSGDDSSSSDSGSDDDERADDDSDAGAGEGSGEASVEGDRSELLDSDDPMAEPGEQSPGGGECDGGEDEGGDPLDYLPDEEAAIDHTDREPVELVVPTIGSDEDLELIDLGLHPEVDEQSDMSDDMDKAVGTAIIQSIYFEQPSQNITGLNIWKYNTAEADAEGRPWHAWNGASFSASAASRRGQTIDPVGESVLGPALMRMRVVFSDNQRSHRNRNMRSGKIDTRSLGKRAWSGDDRLFGRKVVPNKKDYFVGIFMDVSGSTRGVNLKMIKEAALAQAELCHRMGIGFAVYAHTGSPRNIGAYRDGGIDIDLYEVKAPEQPWDNKSREALMALNPSAANLDGHTLEFARKLCDAQPQTNKVILYYSDGAMPLENFDEELEILRREIQTCRSKGYTLLGVGVRTDSPARHGLETVQIDDSQDVGRVVTHLERHLVS